MIFNVNSFIIPFMKHSTYIKHIRNYSAAKSKKVLNLDTMNESIIHMKYAPRGPIARQAVKLRGELLKGKKKPFKEVIFTNLGDPQGLGMCPLTFPRQVATLALYPTLMSKTKYFPSDAIKRADQILHDCLGYSLGSYTHSQGIEIVRRHIAEYINERDGWDVEVNHEDLFTSDGASMIIKVILSFFNNEVNGKPTGVMLPVPQYPLYSAAVDMLGLVKVDYYLDEENNWNLSVKELKKSIDEAKSCCTPRALVIINPGNPTGEVMTRKALEDAVKFAYKEGLFVLADEVYQENVYHEDSEFHSVRKVMIELGMPYSKMELISFHSASKGFSGECGFRAGYAELFNVDRDVKDELIKAVSIALCSNSAGQCILDGIICPPKPNDPSCELFQKEKSSTLSSLAEKAKVIHELLNGIDGIQCNPIQGALYAFPKIKLPKSFIEKAKKKKLEPDDYFCRQFLDKTGVCVVPGSGFGQKPGTYHFRTTILPPMEKMKSMVKSLKGFMEKITKKTCG